MWKGTIVRLIFFTNGLHNPGVIFLFCKIQFHRQRHGSSSAQCSTGQRILPFTNQPHDDERRTINDYEYFSIFLSSDSIIVHFLFYVFFATEI